MRWHYTSTTRCGSWAISRPRASSNPRTGAPPGRGFYFLLEGPSIDAVRQQIDTTLPFVIENLATLDYDEIYEI